MSRVTKLKKQRKAEQVYVEEMDLKEFRRAVAEDTLDRQPYEPLFKKIDYKWRGKSDTEMSLEERIEQLSWDETMIDYAFRHWGLYGQRVAQKAYEKLVSLNPDIPMIKRQITDLRREGQRSRMTSTGIPKIYQFRVGLVGNPDSERVYNAIAKVYDSWDRERNKAVEIEVPLRGFGTLKVGFDYFPEKSE